MVIDLGAIDLSASVANREEIGKINPHRYEMALLDEIVWVNEDLTQAVARHNCAADAFWVRGHFPGRRRFISDVQGVVNGQVAFEARVSGMALDDNKAE